MTSATGKRQSAGERREAILDAATIEFARGGLEGTSTEDIARRAGISQPYVFRLFGTKKELFVGAVERCFRETLETFRAAAAGKSGADALAAMGESYLGLLGDRNKLLLQMQAYAACDDPDVRAVVRRGFGEIVTLAETASGAGPGAVAHWLAQGMLLNVVATMDLTQSEAGWARRLIEGCKEG